MLKLNFIFENKFKLNQIFLKLLLLFSFIAISINFFEWTEKKSYYEYSDWLINYQGGFTRRGLFGEILYIFHEASGLGLDLILYLSVILMYFVFFLFLYRILKQSNLNFLNTLILFSPLSFIYLAFNKTLAGRKEILLFFLLVIFFYNLNKIKFENIKYWIILILTVSSLTHFGFIFYSPFLILFFIFLYPEKKFKELFIQISPILFSGLLIVLFTLYSTIYSKPEIFEICASIKDFVKNCPSETYVRVLNYSISDIRAINISFAGNYYFVKYPIYFILSFTPITIALINLRNNKNYKIKNLFIFLSISLICTIPVFYLGADYGRYLNWQYMFVLLIYLHLINFKFLKQDNKNYFFDSKIPKQMLYIIIFLYGFTWSVPHCCDKNYSFLYDKLIAFIF